LEVWNLAGRCSSDGRGSRSRRTRSRGDDRRGNGGGGGFSSAWTAVVIDPRHNNAVDGGSDRNRTGGLTIILINPGDDIAIDGRGDPVTHVPLGFLVVTVLLQGLLLKLRMCMAMAMLGGY
jgi:hypothetical protein